MTILSENEYNYNRRKYNNTLTIKFNPGFNFQATKFGSLLFKTINDVFLYFQYK